jgi:hypothetical protein
MYTMNRCTLPSWLSSILSNSVNALTGCKVGHKVATKKIAACAIPYWARGLFFINLLLVLPFSAQAQNEVVLTAPDQVALPGAFVGRQFPPKAMRGTLLVQQGADILIDGQPERLSPGARIRGPENALVMTGAIVGQELLVNYVRESYGNIHQIWILTPLEAKQRLATSGPDRNFFFGFEAEKPKIDDGKTPFDQLPKFKQ